jgi:hypothetical protein
MPGSGFLGGSGGEHENAGADDGADAQQRQLQRPQRAMQRFLLRRRQYGVQRFDAIQDHEVFPLSGGASG